MSRRYFTLRSPLNSGEIHRSLERNEPAALLKSRELSVESGRLKLSFYKQIASREPSEKLGRTEDDVEIRKRPWLDHALAFHACLPACLRIREAAGKLCAYHSPSRRKIKRINLVRAVDSKWGNPEEGTQITWNGMDPLRLCHMR
jgi:hypothetical protein